MVLIRKQVRSKCCKKLTIVEHSDCYICIPCTLLSVFYLFENFCNKKLKTKTKTPFNLWSSTFLPLVLFLSLFPHLPEPAYRPDIQGSMFMVGMREIIISGCSSMSSLPPFNIQHLSPLTPVRLCMTICCIIAYNTFELEIAFISSLGKWLNSLRCIYTMK